MTYVPKKIVKKENMLFLNLINSIRKDLRDIGITYSCNLVGSAKRNLVILDHKNNFDFDYQIIIRKNKNKYTPKKIKYAFINLLNKNKGNMFGQCKNRTTSIKIEKNEKNIYNGITSCDIVLIKQDHNGLQIIKKADDNDKYDFNILKNMDSYMNDYKKIKGKMWVELRKKYYDKKIKNNNENLKSFQLLHMVVVEVLKDNGIY